jgi:RimJ/RimL family protein N-acetyltransferase
VDNVKSQRVSEKLRYQRTGIRTITSRGEPVEHYDYRLDRGDWISPIAVQLEGVEQALPLFGAA